MTDMAMRIRAIFTSFSLHSVPGRSSVPWLLIFSRRDVHPIRRRTGAGPAAPTEAAQESISPNRRHALSVTALGPRHNTPHESPVHSNAASAVGSLYVPAYDNPDNLVYGAGYPSVRRPGSCPVRF